MTLHAKFIPDGAIYLMTHYVDQETNILNNKLSISVTKILYKFKGARDIGDLVLQHLIKTFLIFSSDNFQTRLHFLVLRKALRFRTPRAAVQALEVSTKEEKDFHPDFKLFRPWNDQIKTFFNTCSWLKSTCF